MKNDKNVRKVHAPSSVAERRLNAVPNDKILDWSKLNAFADDKINVAEQFKFVFGGVENIVLTEENAGYQSLQTKISEFMKMAESFLKGWKTLKEKEKLLVTGNFSFSHSVFKRRVDLLRTRKNVGFWSTRTYFGLVPIWSTRTYFG